MRTALCDLLGIKVPIVLAPMGGAVGPALSAAVSNAGALGMLPLWRADVATLKKVIGDTRVLTPAPFGINLNLEFPQEERLEAAIDEGVRVVSFFWKDAGTLVRRAKSRGAIVLQTVASADDAKRAVDAGADAVVAQGWEAGGHVRGTVASLPLIPAVVDVVSPTPVVAAGGIADGRGLAAALALGAAGAWIGTRFLASHEASIHPRYRELVLGAKEDETVYAKDLFDRGWANAPHRVLRNKTTVAWEQAGYPAFGQRPGEGQIVANSKSVGPIERYRSMTPSVDVEGDIDAMALWAGQSVGLVSKAQPAAEIIREIGEQARSILTQLGVLASARRAAHDPP